ncbi:hypothetical protein GOBAR_DD11071 [Gossypium barbadense]|nr:hypothetical protein GOBAR_DD11071 [Gossypium barbadense]
MEATIENGPWTVMAYYLILRKWEVEKVIQEIDFSKVNIWVQLHALPLEMLTMGNANTFKSKISSVIKIDSDNMWEKKRWDGKGLATIKYDIVYFCFDCERLGHIQKFCEDDKDKNREEGHVVGKESGGLDSILTKGSVMVINVYDIYVQEISIDIAFCVKEKFLWKHTVVEGVGVQNGKEYHVELPSDDSWEEIGVADEVLAKGLWETYLKRDVSKIVGNEELPLKKLRKIKARNWVNYEDNKENCGAIIKSEFTRGIEDGSMVCKHVKRVKKKGNIRRNKLKMLNSNIWLWEIVVTMHFDGFERFSGQVLGNG